MKRLSILAVALILAGCALMQPYHSAPQASSEDRRECAKHCAPDRWKGARSPEEAGQAEGACRLECSWTDDPRYVEEGDRRNMSDAELLAKGFCRPRDSEGRIIVDPSRGEVRILLAPVNGAPCQ